MTDSPFPSDAPGESPRPLSRPLYVSQPYLPPLGDFLPYLENIWASGFVTNGGQMHQALEQALADYLGVPHIVLFNNGMTALLAALHSLERRGEVITTPFSFVATAHSIVWQSMTPVFVDISPESLNMDPERIEAAITPDTAAIMPVHCYGHPCDTSAIQAIADHRNLPVIYDAAHAFGVDDEGGSILRHGHMSALSFHATKVFNTFEGGALVVQDQETRQRLNQIKNFGFVSETAVSGYGINGKMSEINAAFGLLQLKHTGQVRTRRQAVHDIYVDGLRGIKGLHVHLPANAAGHNHAYFPILVRQEFPISRDALYDALKTSNIYARRYFYPLISNFPAYTNMPSAARANLPMANLAAEQVLCLPIHAGMADDEAHHVVTAIRAIAASGKA